MMKHIMFVVALVAVSVAQEPPVKCNQYCSVVTDFSADGQSFMDRIPDNKTSCSADTIKECDRGQACLSFTLDGTADVLIEGAESAVDGVLKFHNYMCGTAGEQVKDCDGVQGAALYMLQKDAGFTVSQFSGTCGETSDCYRNCLDGDEDEDDEEVTPGVRCYDDCTVVTAFSKDGTSYIDSMIGDDDKSCSTDTIKECADGKVCVSFAIRYTADVIMKGADRESAVTGRMALIYSYCGSDQEVGGQGNCNAFYMEDYVAEDAGLTVSNVEKRCGDITACSEDCVEDEEEEEEEEEDEDDDSEGDYRDYSDAALPKISALLLAGLLAVLAI